MNTRKPLFETRTRCPAFSRSMDILRIDGNDTEVLLLIDPNITWVGVHWNGRFEVRHIPGDEQCPFCNEGKPVRWKGFITCKHRQDPELKLLQVTGRAGDKFERAMGEESMRGVWVLVGRTKKHKQSPLFIEKKGFPNEVLLPASPDIEQTFLAIYGPGAGKKNRV